MVTFKDFSVSCVQLDICNLFALDRILDKKDVIANFTHRAQSWRGSRSKTHLTRCRIDG